MTTPVTVADLTAWLDRFAPPALAEDWDNVGLLLGGLSSPVERVMTCLTVTTETAAEAIDDGVGLLVTHHPVLFRPTKRLLAEPAATGAVWRLARAGVAVYSPHTALDNTRGGINDGLAARLGLVNVGPLRPSQPSLSYKLVIFCPRDDHERVLKALFDAGAGVIGNYEQCSYSLAGTGTFFGNEAAKPTVGQAGRRESVRERRVEVVCPSHALQAALAAARQAHSYEEPAIDVYPLHSEPKGPGVARVGDWPARGTLIDFLKLVREVLPTPGLQWVGPPGRPVSRVAVACGAGDDFVNDAARAGADILLTGEARFHRALEADALGIALVLAGHHATERPGVEDLADRLAEAFPALTVWPSRRERDPIQGDVR